MSYYGAEAHTCGFCGGRWIGSHTCPVRTTTSGPTTIPITGHDHFTSAVLVVCRWCKGSHERRYACDELLAAADSTTA